MSIGSTLRTARESKGLTVSYVAELTNIMVRTIEDLESDNFKRIAAPIYGRGFIKLYAGVLGLDPAPLLDQYNAIVGEGGAVQQPAAPEPPRPPRTVRSPLNPSEQPPIAPRPPVATAVPADEKPALARILEQRMAEEKRTADLILVKPGGVAAPEPAGGLHGVTMTEEEPADDAFAWEAEEEAPEVFEETEAVESPLHGVVVSEEELEAADAAEAAAFAPVEPQPMRFPVKAPMPIDPMPEEIPLVIEQTTPPPPNGEPDLFSMADERKRTLTQPAISPFAQSIPPAGPDRSKLFSRPKNAPIFKPKSAADRGDDPVAREGDGAWVKLGLYARALCGKVIEACSAGWDACCKRFGGDRVLMRPDSFKKMALIASVACAVVLVSVAIYVTMTSTPGAPAEEKAAAAPIALADSAHVKEITPLAPPPPPYFD